MKDFLNTKVNISNKNVYTQGSFFVLSSKSCFLTKKQVEACIGVVSFYIKRYKKNKQFLSNIQYQIPVTKKSKGSRMGSGKGKIKEYISKVNMNGIIFIFRKVKL
jgi:ribosomal protein L16/L10AE